MMDKNSEASWGALNSLEERSDIRMRTKMGKMYMAHRDNQSWILRDNVLQQFPTLVVFEENRMVDLDRGSKACSNEIIG